MKFNMSHCLEAFSIALDFVVMEILSFDKQHSRKVALISLELAKGLELDQDDIKDLYALSLLHDNGVTSSMLEHNYTFEAIELMPGHCFEGESNISFFPFIKDRKNVILYHHENFDGSGIFGKKGQEIPLFSRIIQFADILDIKFKLADLPFFERKSCRLCK